MPFLFLHIYQVFCVSSSLEQTLDGEDLEMQDLDTRYYRVP
jgi:hypothetical protein